MIRLVRESSTTPPAPGFGEDDGVCSDPVADAIPVAPVALFLSPVLHKADQVSRRNQSKGESRVVRRRPIDASGGLAGAGLTIRGEWCAGLAQGRQLLQRREAGRRKSGGASAAEEAAAVLRRFSATTQKKRRKRRKKRNVEEPVANNWHSHIRQPLNETAWTWKWSKSRAPLPRFFFANNNVGRDDPIADTATLCPSSRFTVRSLVQNGIIALLEPMNARQSSLISPIASALKTTFTWKYSESARLLSKQIMS